MTAAADRSQRRCRRTAVRVDHLTLEAPSPRRAPRGSPLRQCWDLTNRPTLMAVLPTLSKTAPRTRRCRRPPVRVDYLKPEAVVSRGSAAEGARGARCAGVPLPKILRPVRRLPVARLVANIVGGGSRGKRDERRPRRLHRAASSPNRQALLRVPRSPHESDSCRSDGCRRSRFSAATPRVGSRSSARR